LLTDLVTRQSVRLNRLLGRPTLVVYYNPHTQTGAQVLEFAKDVSQKLGDRVSIVAMAVTTDPEFAAKQYAELRLPFHVHDGAALRLTFGVDATPRFVILDAEGYLQFSATGWAAHVGEELLETLGRSGKTDKTP